MVFSHKFVNGVEQLRTADVEAEKIAKPKTSSLTGEPECLFKTTLPPNAPTAADAREGKDKKRKRDVVVHELENTTKHASFLRGEPGSKGKKTATEYVEGKGWIDEDGNTVEAEPRKRRTKVKIEEMGPKPRRSRRSSKLEMPVVEITAPKSQYKKKRAPPTTRLLQAVLHLSPRVRVRPRAPKYQLQLVSRPERPFAKLRARAKGLGSVKLEIGSVTL